jgi:hypothetical protein
MDRKTLCFKCGQPEHPAVGGEYSDEQFTCMPCLRALRGRRAARKDKKKKEQK